jgi:hypothetical protein
VTPRASSRPPQWPLDPAIPANPQVGKPSCARPRSQSATQWQKPTLDKCSKYAHDLVELRGFEPRTSCMPCKSGGLPARASEVSTC